MGASLFGCNCVLNYLFLNILIVKLTVLISKHSFSFYIFFSVTVIQSNYMRCKNVLCMLDILRSDLKTLLSVFNLSIKIGSHVFKEGLKLSIYIRMTLNF